VATPKPTAAAAPAGVAAATAAPELTFAVEGSAADLYAAVPTLVLRVRIERLDGGPVRSIGLNAQIRIAATRRAYDERSRERLAEIFGGRDQWARGLRSLLWTNATVQVPPFEGSTVVDLPVPCTYDFEVTTAKYLHALDDGEVPLELLFSGTLFYPSESGALRIAHIPWEKEAEHRMPVAVWKEMMDRYFPGSALLRLERDSFDRLYAYKARNTHLSWESAIDALLACAEPGQSTAEEDG
jgi:hypothetical protein